MRGGRFRILGDLVFFIPVLRGGFPFLSWWITLSYWSNLIKLQIFPVGFQFCIVGTSFVVYGFFVFLGLRGIMVWAL